MHLSKTTIISPHPRCLTSFPILFPASQSTLTRRKDQSSHLDKLFMPEKSYSYQSSPRLPLQFSLRLATQGHFVSWENLWLEIYIREPLLLILLITLLSVNLSLI